MRYVVSAAWIVACLFLTFSFARVALPGSDARAAETVVASVHESGAPSQAGKSVEPRMTPWTREAQVRCPSGKILFLTRECNCNGACCNCGANARYLNHCTCECSANPPPANACMKGFSVGR